MLIREKCAKIENLLSVMATRTFKNIQEKKRKNK